MRSLSMLIIICLLSGCLTAQTRDTASYLKAEQWKINLNLIGSSLTYERKIGRSMVLYLEAGTAFGFSYRYSSALGSEYRYTLSPYVAAEGRSYYHFDERVAKGKSIANNAANFWFLQAGYAFKPISYTAGYTYSDASSIMPGWGIQRNIGQHFSLELQLGLQTSYYSNTGDWYIGPGGQFKIGYLIN